MPKNPKILFHVCCGPCAAFPINQLREQGFKITAFFYNPNIQPQKEYQKRKETLEKYLTKTGTALIETKYNPEEHLNAVEKNLANKCPVCWKLRLEKTAQYARENNFDYFTSTLLSSPHQDIGEIARIGQELEKKYGVKFFSPGKKGFRPGFAESRKIAREENMYRQNYCGCSYSIVE